MDPEKTTSFSIQAEVIRLIQAANGQDSCYAAPVNGECNKTECAWREDCFDEINAAAIVAGARTGVGETVTSSR